MSARDRILTRVRRSAADVPAPDHVRPRQAQPKDPVAQFVEQAEKVHATTSRIASLDDLPMALSKELRDRNLPAAIRTGSDPAFQRDWGTIEHTTGMGRIAEPATLTRAEFAVAETGSLVFASGPENPVTLNFLGETHFAVVESKDVAGGFEDVFATWRAKFGGDGRKPRTTNFVTGPSRSADIGQTLQLGAHGPVALHVFIVGDS
ncbi:MAG: lactate utilization protein C [Paracoccaceae bacterium]